MKLLSSEQMRALDRRCIDELGIPGLELMERAGLAVADRAYEMQLDQPGVVKILCGKGNNGGDGFVAGRLLQERGVPVRIILPFPPDSLSGDARVMYDRAVQAGVPVAETVTDEKLASASLIIDALLGTGVTGPVHGVLGELIERTNALRGGRGVLAVDLPSGVETDTGQVDGPAMRAAATVTMGLPKPCLVLYPGAELAGAWTVADIGFPPEVVASWPAVAEITEGEQAASWVPRRTPTAYKGSNGYALIIAGSFGMTGAASMSSTSAYRSGAGLVRLAVPATLVQALNATLTEVVFRPMPATPAGTLSFHAAQLLLAEADEVQATLIGPGLSRNAATRNAMQRLVAQWPGPLVVDADALTAMAGQDALWGQRKAPTIITPHPGEMSRLLGKPIKELEQNRIDTAKTAAQRFNAVTVFKGAPTVVAAPDGRAFVNPTGNAGLAVAGTGDTLSGSIVAFLAQGLAPLEAAVLACYVGGRAAEIGTAQRGIHGFTAPDLAAAIPLAINALIAER
ncbi:MAG TPA: NAD(P)H-hydrate dehydratase [Armatimonadota bacterium]|jgi:NAD(P)H-hydrate epimerase